MSFPNELENCNDYDPNDELTWSNDTERMFQGLRLLELVEKEIKGMKLLFDETKDHSVGYSLIRLQSLSDDAKKQITKETNCEND